MIKMLSFLIIAVIISISIFLVRSSFFSSVSLPQQPSTCSADVWSCGDWSPCHVSGNQARSCALLIDCPNTILPIKPLESQACTPPSPDDLAMLYKQKPSQWVIDQITKDFNITWENNPTTGEAWPSDFSFNQDSSQPSKMVIISRLNILKNQTFSEPLPFTSLSIYDYLKENINKIIINLNCNFNYGGESTLNLNSSSGNWRWLESGTCNPTQDFAPYMDHLQLLIHETRHSEAGEPGHMLSCGNVGDIPWAHDQYFENGSGYAYAAQYLMWVYKYSVNDPPEVKERAKQDAITLLENRFCSKPTHSNPKVQAIIDELIK
ncbi:MAG: hypothetical protein ABII19_00635 [Patescibacteria group bacterium]